MRFMNVMSTENIRFMNAIEEIQNEF
jgi:hypothetical protein